MTPLVVLAAAFGVYVWLRAFVVEPYSVDVAEKEIAVAGLPAELDGALIAHLSDFHLREIGDREWAVIEAVRRAEPDLVCITGDFVSDRRGMQLLVPFLMELTRGRRTFAVLGNHDHADGVDTAALKESLRRAGVELLVNESRRILLRGAPVRIVGVDDPASGRDDLERSLGVGEPAGGSAFVLLLAHSPDILLAPRVGEADLVLAGHTHGGQVRLPVIGPLVTHTRIGRAAAAGVVRREGTVAHVSRGLGETGVRMRLFCRPEVALLRLTPSRTGP